ncbi:pilus assembly protein TadG-related protein [Streptomyces sp. NBC_00234]|uniref:pilus assembly protein TadG-related protein n=1 Tax=Streptomyces sp. NBC_00234 TaxID=2903638 RepID=UPI002E29D621|nr:pilus assembly protein TadG-related protein [Streptomyces sp. NBC_00234]
MSQSADHESGQAAPLYITAVVGLLFLALIFFAFGEADVRRNGAQSASDAAALAAAQESRSLEAVDLRAHILDRAYLTLVFNGPYPGTHNGCVKASRFAAQNDAMSVDCRMLFDGRWGFTVGVQSDKGMSANLVPGTEGKRAKATSVAVVEPRCKFIPNPDLTSPSPGALACDTKVWVIDPKDLALLPEMTELFTVRLAD